ncbi:MAG: MGMT family protein [Fimbriimonadaceae bacterium]
MHAIVRRIPSGRVASYGDLGGLLEPPVSGWMTGRAMAQISDAAPWWRVVARTGHLPVGKRDPRLEITQRERLEAEGVRFCGDRIERDCFLTEQELWALLK